MPQPEHPFFVISNTHAPASGTPPHLTNADPATYLGYFVNEHGDQWVFAFDRKTQRATLYGGDTNWERPITLTSLDALSPSFTASERLWIEACWKAATGGSIMMQQ